MHKDKKTIKKDILDKFRSITDDEDYFLPPFWLKEQYLKSLHPEEKKIFEKAIEELIYKGIIENIDSPALNLKLTEKGANLIYYYD
ncbi:MAG: hypothetical protein JW786_06580 [Desulfobacterales bacterium]|nr:hypothetical protein [Desulfobacterales bacterium]